MSWVIGVSVAASTGFRLQRSCWWRCVAALTLGLAVAQVAAAQPIQSAPAAAQPSSVVASADNDGKPAATKERGGTAESADANGNTDAVVTGNTVPSEAADAVAMGAGNVALLLGALFASALAITVVARKGFLKLAKTAHARVVTGLPAGGWLGGAFVLYFGSIIGATAGAISAAAAPGAVDLRTGALSAIWAYGAGFVVFGVFAAALAWQPATRSALRDAGVWAPVRWNHIAVGAIGLALALPVVWLLLTVSQFIEALWTGQAPDPLAHETLRSLHDHDMASLWWWLTTLGAVALAPMFEELLYRGMLQSAVRSAVGSPSVAVVSTALVFSLAHAGGGADLDALPALFVLGLVFGALFERTGVIWPSIVAHAGFNALNVVISLAIG